MAKKHPKYICSEAARCKYSKCAAKRPHAKTFDWERGVFCCDYSRECSFTELDTKVTCVEVK